MGDTGGTATVEVEAGVLAHTRSMKNIGIMMIALVMEAVDMTGDMMLMIAMAIVGEEPEAVVLEVIEEVAAGAIVQDVIGVQFEKVVQKEELKLNSGTGKKKLKHHLPLPIILCKMEERTQIHRVIMTADCVGLVIFGYPSSYRRDIHRQLNGACFKLALVDCTALIWEKYGF